MRLFNIYLRLLFALPVLIACEQQERVKPEVSVENIFQKPAHFPEPDYPIKDKPVTAR